MKKKGLILSNINNQDLKNFDLAKIYDLLANPQHLEKILDNLNKTELYLSIRLKAEIENLTPSEMREITTSLKTLQELKESLIRTLKEITTPPQENLLELTQDLKILVTYIDKILQQNYNTTLLNILTDVLKEKFNIDVSELLQTEKHYQTLLKEKQTLN
mgnify:FL=1